MKLKTLAPVVGLLAAGTAALYFLRGDPSGSPARAAHGADSARLGQALLPRTTLAEANQIRLRAESGTSTLTRGTDGTWTVDEYHGLPIDFDRLARLTRSLQESKADTLVSRNPERLARLELDKTEITLLAQGQATWSLAVGRAVPEGGRYVRFGAEGAAYATAWDAFIEGSPRNWAQTQLLSFNSGDVRRLEIRWPEAGSFTVARETREAELAPATGSVPEGRTLDSAVVSRVLGNLSSLRFSDTAALDDPDVVAARAAARLLKVDLFDNTTFHIRIGRRPAPPAPPPPPPAAEGSPPPSTPEAPRPGPVYVFIEHSQADAPVNALMQRRAFAIGEWIFDGIPATAEGFLTSPPAAALAPAPEVTTGPRSDLGPLEAATPPLTVPSLEAASPPVALPPAEPPPPTPTDPAAPPPSRA